MLFHARLKALVSYDIQGVNPQCISPPAQPTKAVQIEYRFCHNKTLRRAVPTASEERADTERSCIAVIRFGCVKVKSNKVPFKM